MVACRSHDRALPEIPASASGVASTDDDDEEDEGHYDVISKSRRAAIAANSRTQKPRFCHPYEIVAGDLDSTYAGIREELEAAISHRNSRGRASNSCSAAEAAVAAGISDPLYAGITDNSTRATNASAAVGAVPPANSSTYSTVVSNAQALQLHLSDNVVELDGTVSTSVRNDGDVHSPLLPPRNGNVDSVDDGVVTAAASSMSNAWSLSASTANSGPGVSTTAAVHSDPSVHVQEQLLHNSANADAMPVSGVLMDDVMLLC